MQGDDSSFFRQELERWRDIDISQQFKQFAWKVNPLCRNMKLLLHHADTIISEILETLKAHNSVCWKALLALLAVLARDLKTEVYKRWLDIVPVLKSMIQPIAAPEITAETFRTISFLFKYLANDILNDPEYGARFNDWIGYLSHKRTFVRESMASALALLLRRATSHAQRTQLYNILRGAAVVPEPDKRSMKSLDSFLQSSAECTVQGARSKTPEYKDGISLLIFESISGPNNSFHSRTQKLLPFLLASTSPKKSKFFELFDKASNMGVSSSQSTPLKDAGSKRTRDKGDSAIVAEETSDRYLPLVSLYQLTTSLRFEIVAQTLRYACAHTNGTHNDCKEVWLLLISGLRNSLKQFVEAEAALGKNVSTIGNSTSMGNSKSLVEQAAASQLASIRAKRAAKASNGSAKQSAENSQPSSRSLPDEYYAISAGIHVGMMAGLLYNWINYRKGSRVPLWAPELSDVLLEVFSSSVWKSENLPGLTRVVLLRLLVSSWRHVCTPKSKELLPKSKSPEIKFANSGKTSLQPQKRIRRQRRLSFDSDDETAIATIEKEPGDVESVKSDGSEDEIMDDVDLDLWNAEAHRLGKRLLQSVFDVPKTLPIVRFEILSEVIVSSACGIILAQNTEEGLQYPDLHRGGKSADYRPIHVGTLDATSSILSFARHMIVLTNHIQDEELRLVLASGGNEDIVPKAGVATLQLLLPALSGYITSLMKSTSIGIQSSLSNEDEEVVWSLLLSARDAVIPRGSRKGLLGLQRDIPGIITRCGRLVLSQDEEEDSSVGMLLLQRLRAIQTQIGPFVDSFVSTLVDAYQSGDIEQHEADSKFQDVLRPVYGAVSAASTVVLPLIETVSVLKDIYLTCVDSFHKISSSFQTAGLVTAPWKLPKSLGILQHVASSALLSLSRFLKETDNSLFAQLSEKSLASIFSSTFAQNILHWLFETTKSVPVASMSHAVEAFGSPDGLRATASALAALNASAEFFLVMKNSSPVEVYNEILTKALGISVTYHLRELLGHRDHAIRLSALRVMNAFPAEDYLHSAELAPAMLEVLVPRDSKSELQTFRALLDEKVQASADSTLSGSCPVLMLMLQLELLPNTIATERLRLTLITRICVYVATKKVPPVTIVALMYFSLGLFFTRFAPISKASQKFVLACAEIYPRTLWSIFCRHLYAACIDRQPPLDTSAGASTTVLAKSRSQGRSERINAPTAPLRVSALAVNAATGHSTDAMSMAGTIIAEAATAEALLHEDSTDSSAALPPGREELAHRIESLLEGGLYGADAGIVDEEVKKAKDFDGSMFTTSEGEVARYKRDMMGSAVSHEVVHINDSVPLILGESGWFDSETIHKSLLEVLVAAPTWAEGRARTLIPLFLAFVAYDYFGRTFVGDPDGYELQLDLQLQSLLQKHKQFQKDRIARRTQTQDDTASSTDIIADTDILLERLVMGDDLKNASVALSRSTASARLISYLRVLAGFSGWKNMIGQDVVRNAVMRFVGRPDDGIGNAAFQVLVSMKLSELMPYKDTLSRFLGETSYREEIANFSLAHDSGNIALEHRPFLIPLIVRVLQGRLLARKFNGHRDTPTARRNTILSYFGTLKSDEMASVLYVTMRPFLLASSEKQPATDTEVPVPGTTLEDMQRILASYPLPKTEQEAIAMVVRIRTSFASQGGVCEGSVLVNAARAVGFLNLLQTLIKRVGTSMAPYMHVIVGILVACLHETRVLLNELDSQEMDDLDSDSIGDFDEFNNSLENPEQDMDSVSLTNVNSSSAERNVIADALIEDTGTTTLQHKAKEIRTLALSRLSDIFENWAMLTGQSYQDVVPFFSPWLPLMRESLDVAIDMLPTAMMHSSKPSAVLNFLYTMSKDAGLFQIVSMFPNALPAVIACSTTGIEGSDELYLEHKKFVATGEATMAMDKFLQVRDSSSMGPHLNVLNAVFQIIDNFVEFGSVRSIDEEGNRTVSVDSNEQSTYALVLKHIPYLLKHLILRLGASTKSPQTLNVLLEAVENGTPLVSLPSLKGGVRAFAKRQLSILSKISDLIVAKDTKKFLNIEQSAIIQRLVVLLLPFTKLRSSRSNSSNKRGHVSSLEEDPAILVLEILCKFAPYLPEKASVVFLPMFSQMLAPGPRALEGKHRVMIARLLNSLSQQTSMRHLENGMTILQQLCATANTLIGEIDYDSVFNGLEAFVSFQNLNSFVTPGKSARALPALLYQIVHLMMDVDTSVRTAALNAATTVVRTVAQHAITQWRTDMETFKELAVPVEPLQISIPSVLTCDNLPAHEISLFVVGNILVPSIRAAMNTASPTLRRGLLTLLADVVREFREYGAICTELTAPDQDIAQGEQGNENKNPSSLVRATEQSLLDKLEQQLEKHMEYKYDYYISHPNLYSDLGILINKENPEADVFLNLSHVQIHRRAHALNRLAGFVKENMFTINTVRTILLPLTLHSLYDEAGAAGGIDVVVETKGKTASLNQKGSAANAGYSSGLHAEAVKLIGAVAKVIPFPLYISTLRSLIRQVEKCEKGPLEKVLVRAISVMAEGFHFDIVSTLSDADIPSFRCDERTFCRHLISILDSWGLTGRTVRSEALALNDGDDADDTNSQKMDVDERDESSSQHSVDEAQVLKHDKIEDVSLENSENEANDEEEEEDDVKEEHEMEISFLRNDYPKAISQEISRRSVLLTLATDILPQLRRILHRPEEVKEAESESSLEKPTVSKHKRPTGELRPPVAQALVSFYRILPKSVFFAQMPNVLVDLAGALKSRRQVNRDTARATLARTALALGPSWLSSIIESLRSTLYADGYQLHVLGHAVFGVVEILAPHMVPVAPPTPIMKAGKGLARKERTKTRLNAEKQATQQSVEQAGEEEMSHLDEEIELEPQEGALENVMDEDDNILNSGNLDDSERPGAGSLHLAKCVPALMDIIMEEVNGAAAEAKAAGSGYKPKESLGLKEAKRSRAGDTLEIISKCIPFLPHPCLHYVTAPIIAAFEDDAMKGFGKYTTALHELFRRVSVGLAHNPSVTGPYLLLYAHGICTEFLRISTLVAARHLLREQELAQEDTIITQKALEALPAEHSAYQEAYAKFAKFLRPKGVGKMKTINPWMTRDVTSIVESKHGHLNSDGTSKHSASNSAESTIPMTGAMRLKGARASSVNPDLYRILPEPRMTGVGRYVHTDKGGRNSGASSAANVPMGSFALSLILAGLTKHHISLQDPLHRQMLDPYIVLLLRLLEEEKDTKVTTLVMRLFTSLLNSGLPMIRKLGSRICRVVLSIVERTSGGSTTRDDMSPRTELAQATLRATTVLVRACEHTKISEEQLRALLAIIRQDIHIPARQSATFSLLRAILGRKLVCVEVYDVMDTCAKLLVTALSPSARSQASGAFLLFLLHYPMVDKVLTRHLDFFIRNLGYDLEPGRLSVIDILSAIINKFPQPVLDTQASALLLPFAFRLASDPSVTCRAGVSALISQLMKSISQVTAIEMVGLAVQWFNPNGKAGIRKIAAQVLSLIVDARPDLFSQNSLMESGVLRAIASALTSELLSASIEVVLIEYNAEKQFLAKQENMRLKRERALARKAGLSDPTDLTSASSAHEDGMDEDIGESVVASTPQMSEDDSEGSNDEELELSAPTLADVPAPDLESSTLAQQRAMARVRAISSGRSLLGADDKDPEEDAFALTKIDAEVVTSSMKEWDIDEEYVEEAQYSRYKGTTGGEFEKDDDDTTSSGFVDPFNSSSRKKKNVLNVSLQWEPVYHALIAAEKLWSHCHESIESAISEENIALSTGDDCDALLNTSVEALNGKGISPVQKLELLTKQYIASLVKAVPEDWKPISGTFSTHDISTTCLDLLTYPHAWVRLASSRLLGLILSKRDLVALTEVGEEVAQQTSLHVEYSISNNESDPQIVTAESDDEDQGEKDLDGDQEIDDSVMERFEELCVEMYSDRDPMLPWVASRTILRRIARSSTTQLTSSHLTTVLAEQVCKNLIFVTLGLHATTPIARRNPVHPLVLEGHKRDLEIEQASEQGEDEVMSEKQNEAQQETNVSAADLSRPYKFSFHDPVYSIISRITNIARTHGDLPKSIALKFIAAMAMKLPPRELRRYLYPIVRLLFRLTSVDLRASEITPETRALANEAMEFVQSTVGVHAFLRLFNAERARVSSARIARKREQAIKKIVNPEEAEMLRRKKHENAAKRRKAKIAAFKAARGAVTQPLPSKKVKSSKRSGTYKKRSQKPDGNVRHQLGGASVRRPPIVQ